ncbi:pro-Pol polyprotein [Trichonephila clavipes]|nr:pro-Pol polyprotein [Trichonephila clavipes]
MNSPVQLAEKLEFEDFKRTLKQKSSSPFVKKQEFKSTEKNRRYEAPGKFEYNRKDKKFPASTNYNKHYEAPITKYESVQRYQDSALKGYYNKNYEKHSNPNASKHAQTNYSKSQKFKEPPKETCTLSVKEDAFTKFTWLYPVKTVSAESALEKLKQQQKTFGNSIRIISDRGSAFTSKLFNDYCDEENIQHLQIATGVPRGNGQVE